MENALSVVDELADLYVISFSTDEIEQEMASNLFMQKFLAYQKSNGCVKQLRQAVIKKSEEVELIANLNQLIRSNEEQIFKTMSPKEKLAKLIDDFKEAFEKVDWKTQAFSNEKSYLFALASQIAYAIVPEEEKKQTKGKRYAIIPSTAYQDRIIEQLSDSEDVRIPGFDSDNYFVIFRRSVFIVGIRIQDKLIIAFRGTINSYDWRANLWAFKARTPFGMTFHSGFYRAVLECKAEIAYEIERITPKDGKPLKLYTTGHSLGGAMSAVFMNLCGKRGSKEYDFVDCYTFGMPNFCNEVTLAAIEHPNHILNSQDIVPEVPPSWMGYSHVRNEYSAAGARVTDRQKRFFSHMSWLYRLITLKGIEAHSLDGYLATIKKALTKR